MADVSSDAQRAVIEHGDGPAIVIAGPGSGKTFCITRRLDRLINHNNVDPPDILTLTYTNAAAKEMEQRAVGFMGDKAKGITFGTFHSVFFSVLSRHFRLSYKNILNPKARYMIIRDLIREFKIDASDINALCEELTANISRVKNNVGSVQDMMSPSDNISFEEVAERYEEKLKELRLIDFDDMILKCRSLFIRYPDILDEYRRKYKYIQVDEFQDINSVQYDVVRMLAAKDGNILVVGDDDQSIYGFRGAAPGIMKQFMEDFHGCARYELSVNYRCTGAIVEAGKKLISHNLDRIVKHPEAFDVTGERVEIRHLLNRDDEVRAIADIIDSRFPEDYAVLARTNGIASVIAGGLSRIGIKVSGKNRKYNVYETEAGKDILSYLKIAAGIYKREDILRVMNKPVRYIGREAFFKADCSLEDGLVYYKGDEERENSIRKWITDMKRISNMHPDAAMKYLLNIIGYQKYARSDGADIRILEELSKRAERYLTLKEWLYAVSNNKESEYEDDTAGGVSVMSIHASKGLEYKEVFIVDVNEGVIPGRRMKLMQEIEEERRLMYVGMTRAEKKLHLFYIDDEYGKKMRPSGFLEEVR